MSGFPDDAASILVFGADEATSQGESLVLSSRRVPFEAIRQNLAAVIGQVGELGRVACKAIGDVDLAYVDVQLSIGIDGSVGLFGTGASASGKGTLTVRLVPPPTTSVKKI